MKNFLLTCTAASALLASAATGQIVLRPLATVDLDSTADPNNPEFIGSNPSAVAWDGSSLFVAGFNSAGATADVGVTKVTDVLGTPAIQPAFFTIATPNLRGFSGLDVSGGLVAAAYDNGGAAAEGISGWDTDGNLLWTKTARGGSGVGFDPGFPGGDPMMGSGVGWTTFGSGRRALQDAASGADIWTTANGMIILTSEGTFWRDMDYDDATGDVWLREGNNVIHAVRGGDNAIASTSVPFDPADADFVNIQNVAFARVGDRQAVFFNDRSTTSGGQAFADVVKVIAPDGSDLVVDWGGFTAPDGVGAYDFSWDAGSSTLAILDFANRDVHLFSVTSACAVLGVTGDGTPGSTLTFDLTGAAAEKPAVLAIGATPGETTLRLGVLGTLVLGLDHPIVPLFMGPTDANGDASLSITLPPGNLPAAELYAQGFTVTFTPPRRGHPLLEFCTSTVAGFSIGNP